MLATLQVGVWALLQLVPIDEVLVRVVNLGGDADTTGTAAARSDDAYDPVAGDHFSTTTRGVIEIEPSRPWTCQQTGDPPHHRETEKHSYHCTLPSGAVSPTTVSTLRSAASRTTPTAGDGKVGQQGGCDDDQTLQTHDRYQ